MHICRFAACSLIFAIAGCQTPLILHKSANLGQIMDDGNSEDTTATVDLNEKAIALRFAVASAAETRGDEQVAIDNYEKLLLEDPSHTKALRRLALLYGKRGSSQKSTELFKAAIENDTRDAELCCDYGYALYLAGSFTEAEKQLKAAIVLEPELNRARNIIGMIMARTDQHELAIREFTCANVPRSEAYANIALAMLINGDIVAAEENIRMAESLGPSKELQERLGQYRNSMDAIGISDIAGGASGASQRVDG
jgi:tetratricopeptide (TPR) repeat protein